MPPRIERIYVLTLALEEALQNERWEEAEALFGTRDSALAELERAALSRSERQRLNDIRELERRILGSLQQGRRDVLDTIAQSNTGRRMMQAYRAA